MDNVLISIIIPVYNVEKYLPKCIDSCIAQTYTNIEILLIDDGSPDNCGVICDDYQRKDKRIKVIHQENAGVTEARITGFKNSSGDYIAYIDSDDYISPTYIEVLYNCIKKYHVSVSCCQVVKVYCMQHKNDTRSELGHYERIQIDKLLSSGALYDYSQKRPSIFWGLCGKLFEKQWLVSAFEVGKGLWMGEDLLSYLYILYRIPSLYISSEHLYYYIQHQTQSTRRGDIDTWNNQIEQWKRIIAIDKKEFLKNQLPYRILLYLQVFIKNNLQNKISYHKFKDVINLSLESDLMQEYFISYDFKSLTLIDRIFVYLIKKQNFLIVYGVSYIGVKLLNYRNFKKWN